MRFFKGEMNRRLKLKVFQKNLKQRRARFSESFHNPLKDKSFVSLLPNLTTLLGLCVGITAVRFAISGNFEYSVIMVMIAAFIDGMDGRLARYLNSTSHFGAELDSFSDLVTFGVAPGLVLYYKALSEYGRFGWIIVLFYICCMALRLARFNVLTIEAVEGDTPEWQKQFFVGVPAPAGAFLAFSPLMFSFWCTTCVPTYIYCIVLALTAFLLVSRIPTFSMKKMTVQKKYILPIMLLCIFIFGAFLSEPWLTLSLGSIGYLGLIPFSIKFHRKYKEGF